jgi:cellulose biosynthesis protein BcsQ
MAFTDFDAPAIPEAVDAAPPGSDRSPRARRADFYDTPIVDGRPAPNTPLTRLRDRLRALFLAAGEREEAQLETSLRRLPGVSRTNIVATLSPKGGCGKTTSTFLTGNVLASHLRLRVLAVDLNPDFGTLADLAPDRARAPLSLVDLLRDKDAIASPGELRPYVSRLPSGLHLLAAPPDPAVMAQMTPELYGELVAFLRRFYEVILLDLGTGVTAPIATFAVEHADQVVVVTTPEWITNTKVQMALGHLRLERDARAQQGRRKRRAARHRAPVQPRPDRPARDHPRRRPAQDDARLRHLLAVRPRALDTRPDQAARPRGRDAAGVVAATRTTPASPAWRRASSRLRRAGIPTGSAANVRPQRPTR